MADYRKPGFFGQMKQDQQLADQAMSNVFQQDFNQSLGFAPGAIVNNPSQFMPDPHGTGVPARKPVQEANVLPQAFGSQTSGGFQIGDNDIALSESNVAGGQHLFYSTQGSGIQARYRKPDGTEASYNPETYHITSGGQIVRGGTDPEVMSRLGNIDKELSSPAMTPFTYRQNAGKTEVISRPTQNQPSMPSSVPGLGYPMPIKLPVVPQDATTRPGGFKFNPGVPLGSNIYQGPTMTKGPPQQLPQQPPASPAISPQSPDPAAIPETPPQQVPDFNQGTQAAGSTPMMFAGAPFSPQGPPPPPPGMRASPMGGYIPDQGVPNDPRLEGTKQWPIGTHPAHGQTGSYYGSGVTPLAPEHVVPGQNAPLPQGQGELSTPNQPGHGYGSATSPKTAQEVVEDALNQATVSIEDIGTPGAGADSGILQRIRENRQRRRSQRKQNKGR